MSTFEFTGGTIPKFSTRYKQVQLDVLASGPGTKTQIFSEEVEIQGIVVSCDPTGSGGSFTNEGAAYFEDENGTILGGIGTSKFSAVLKCPSLWNFNELYARTIFSNTGAPLKVTVFYRETG